MARKPDPTVVLQNAREQLAFARRGHRDITVTDANQHAIGLYNAVVFGRSVAHILERLKSGRRQQFDTWFAPYKQQFESDPLLKWFTDLRN